MSQLPNFVTIFLMSRNLQRGKKSAPFDISTRYELALVPLENFASTKAARWQHWMQNDLPQFELVLDCLSSKNTLGIVLKILDSSFRISVDIHQFYINLPREKFTSISHHSKMMLESVR